MCGAFYPNYFKVGNTDEEAGTRQLGGHNPRSTVMVGKPLYYVCVFFCVTNSLSLTLD